jgi:hypothetical protein
MTSGQSILARARLTPGLLNDEDLEELTLKRGDRTGAGIG